MHEEEIKIKYDSATPEELSKAFIHSRKLERQAEALNENVNNIRNRIVATVSGKFKKTDALPKDIVNAQIQEMSKQWRLMSASMVQVKRTVALPGFHASLNLCVNSRYGVKEHKRYSGWSPFAYYDVENGIGKPTPFSFASEKLSINDTYGGETVVMDFLILQGISQLDARRAALLAEITKDIVSMIDSWRRFYNNRDMSMMEDIKMLEGTEQGYNIREEDRYLNCLRKLDTIVNYKAQLTIDFAAHAAGWASTIDRWKEHNKNFLVLNELSKTSLNI